MSGSRYLKPPALPGVPDYHSSSSTTLTCDLATYSRLSIPVDVTVSVTLLYPQKAYPISIQATELNWPSFSFASAPSPAPNKAVKPWYIPKPGTETTINPQTRAPNSYTYQFRTSETFNLTLKGNDAIWKVDYEASFVPPEKIKPKYSKIVHSKIGDSKRIRVQIQNQKDDESYQGFDTLFEDTLSSGKWKMEVGIDAESLPEITLKPLGSRG